MEKHLKTEGNIWTWLPLSLWVRCGKAQRSSNYQGYLNIDPTRNHFHHVEGRTVQPIHKCKLLKPPASRGPAGTQTACSRVGFTVTGTPTQIEVTAINLDHLNNRQFQRNLFLLTSWIIWCDMIAFTHGKLRGFLAVNWSDWLFFIAIDFLSQKLKIF